MRCGFCGYTTFDFEVCPRCGKRPAEQRKRDFLSTWKEGLGFGLAITGVVVQLLPIFGTSLTILSHLPWFIETLSVLGLFLYTRAKDRHWGWSLLGLLGIFGTIPALIALAAPPPTSHFRKVLIAGGVVTAIVLGLAVVALLILSFEQKIAKRVEAQSGLASLHSALEAYRAVNRSYRANSLEELGWAPPHRPTGGRGRSYTFWYAVGPDQVVTRLPGGPTGIVRGQRAGRLGSDLRCRTIDEKRKLVHVSDDVAN